MDPLRPLVHSSYRQRRRKATDLGDPARVRQTGVTSLLGKKEPLKSQQTGASANLPGEESLNRAGSSPVHPAIF
jgi:hypothetical protein